MKPVRCALCSPLPNAKPACRALANGRLASAHNIWMLCGAKPLSAQPFYATCLSRVKSITSWQSWIRNIPSNRVSYGLVYEDKCFIRSCFRVSSSRNGGPWRWLQCPVVPASSCSRWRRRRASRQLSASSQEGVCVGSNRISKNTRRSRSFRSAPIRWPASAVRMRGDDQGGKDLLGFEALIQAALLQALREFPAESSASISMRIKRRSMASRFTDELRLSFHLAAALRGSFAQSCAQDGFVNAQLLRDARGPFGSQ